MPSLRTLTRLWYLAIAVVLFVGFAIQFYLLFTGGSDANSGESGTTVPTIVRFARLFSFFTIASNVFVLVLSTLLAIQPERTGKAWRSFHLAGLLSIVVTGTVFSLILEAGLQLRDAAVVVTALFHQVSPILFTVGWLAFGPRRTWSWRLAPSVLVWPAAWLVFTFVRGAITGWYPYPFIDAGVLGLGPALLNAGFVVVYAVVLMVVLSLIDRWLPVLPVWNVKRQLAAPGS